MISDNFSKYQDDDRLIYIDHFGEEPDFTPFSQIWDTREMKGNGKNICFAIPRDFNYGVAITGLIDPEEQFLPVRI